MSNKVKIYVSLSGTVRFSGEIEADLQAAKDLDAKLERGGPMGMEYVADVFGAFQGCDIEFDECHDWIVTEASQ